ncbi:hypothetical protein AB1Y20_011018 [Prymnesium parvum]|uniref:carnosine N-methyltransferase n=1 Tax=Prymnesium parvum TaxID=97485 RepID=A0AB34ILC6_PRYPA
MQHSESCVQSFRNDLRVAISLLFLASMHTETPPPPPPDDDDIREVQHFATILRAYDNYLPWARRRLRRLADDYARLGAPHRAALRLDEKLEAMHRAAEANGAAIARLVAPHRAHVGSDVLHMFVLADDGRGGVRATAAAGAAYVPESDMEKVQSTLKQCVREWGEEGEEERREAHTPLLTALRETVPVGGGEARVLLPGAGLGRLAWEVARLGYKAQGCEFSYFMLLASNFIMNGLGGERVVIHPWVLQTCNTRSIEDAVRPAEVPAVSPAELEATCNL